MECPARLRTALIEVLYWTLIEIRAYGNEADYAVALADHAHNIPHLIDSYSFDRLSYYWECERECFLRALDRIGKKPQMRLEASWDVIAEEYEKQKAEQGVGGQPATRCEFEIEP